ncbi:e1d2cbd0-62cc-4619-bae2-789f4521a041 [Sclerotinia trifoliorum]|uniref:E1d2cbd0-62cc-4619-bae2-789f4521a041 n=1 Tax=Sclerotinia trifoliorum TaxID=28548 RepID=A0A8H2ZSD3_9HELO|nr:e1d2cbd0-62cc-4619-bae2-789f4521a041 [Sclerotinia trifoliorum]
MASASKPASTTSAPRRKSSGPKEKNTLIIILKLSPEKLRSVGQPLIKEDTPSKESTSTIPTTIPVATSQNGDVPTESNSNTPAPNGTVTPVPSSMPPPTEAIKKKGGVKRSSTAALGSESTPRVRGKPGPKKKARLDDGTIDPTGNTPRATNANGTSHRLGPKANQGAINAGLRALDRSGKPCRKWEKRSFIIKTFTGIPIEIPRWRAPPKVAINHSTEGSSTGDSSKENKDNSQVESEKSNSAMDVDATHLASSPAPALTPALVPAPQAEAKAQAQDQPSAVITASA